MIVHRNRYVNVEIDPFVLLLLIFICFFGYLCQFVTIFIAILLHELGHAAVAAVTGSEISSFRILPVGLNIIIDDKACSKWQRVAIYCSGPFVNIVLAITGYIINTYYFIQQDNMGFFILANIYLACFNLLPILPLDGGKIIRELLADRIGLLLANIFIRKLTLLFAGILLLLGVAQLIRNIYNYNLLLIGIYLFFTLKSEDMEAALMNIKNVIYRRSRLLKKGIYPARDLVAIKSMHLGGVLKNMDFDRFHMVYVLDNELRLIKVFTEQEILDGMLKYNTDITFEELIEKTGDTGLGIPASGK